MVEILKKLLLLKIFNISFYKRHKMLYNAFILQKCPKQAIMVIIVDNGLFLMFLTCSSVLKEQAKSKIYMVLRVCFYFPSNVIFFIIVYTKNQLKDIEVFTRALRVLFPVCSMEHYLFKQLSSAVDLHMNYFMFSKITLM